MKRTLKYILEKQLFMKKKEIDNVVITLCKGCLLENRKKLNAVLTNNRPLIGSLDILENVYFDMHGNCHFNGTTKELKSVRNFLVKQFRFTKPVEKKVRRKVIKNPDTNPRYINVFRKMLYSKTKINSDPVVRNPPH